MRIFNSKFPTIVSHDGYQMIHVPTELMEGLRSTSVKDDIYEDRIIVTAEFEANSASMKDVMAIENYINSEPITTKVGVIEPKLPRHIEDIGGGRFKIYED